MTTKKHSTRNGKLMRRKKRYKTGRSKTTNKRRNNKASKTMNKKYRKKGGNNDEKVKCCICGMSKNINETLIPLDCLRKQREKGKGPHRLCQNCWWNEDTGFAIEGKNHMCPCCKDGKPLPTLKIKEPKDVIDLTLDDSDEDN